jgi:hypothetical protein
MLLKSVFTHRMYLLLITLMGLFIVSQTSCTILKTKNEDIAGLYGSKCHRRYMDDCVQVLLKPDGTFEWGRNFSLTDHHYWEGTWTQLGNTLLLNTYKQPADSLVEEMKNGFRFEDTEYIIGLQLMIKKGKLYRGNMRNDNIHKKYYLEKVELSENKIQEMKNNTTKVRL